MTKHPEKQGERNPLTSRKLRRELMKNRFVPKKTVSESGTEVDLPPRPKPEVPPLQPQQPQQPKPGDPVPTR
jgi:hypothetical protein